MNSSLPHTAVIGRGRMGRAFARALRGAALSVTALPGIRFDPVLLQDRAFTLSRGKRLWILAVIDSALPTFAKILEGLVREGDVVLHLAGMLGPEVLSPLRGAGAVVGSLHPLWAVADSKAPASLRSATLVFEGDPSAEATAREIAEALRGQLVVATGIDRAAYHSGAALLATGAVALGQGSSAMFAKALTPAPNPDQLSAMVTSLLRSVAKNIDAVGPMKALASPLLRGEVPTLARHLDAQRGVSEPIAELYRSALKVVLETLEREGSLRPETLRDAWSVVRGEGA